MSFDLVWSFAVLNKTVFYCTIFFKQSLTCHLAIFIHETKISTRTELERVLSGLNNLPHSFSPWIQHPSFTKIFTFFVYSSKDNYLSLIPSAKNRIISRQERLIGLNLLPLGGSNWCWFVNVGKFLDRVSWPTSIISTSQNIQCLSKCAAWM